MPGQNRKEQSKICVCVKFVVYYTLSLKKQKPLGMPGRRGALPCRTRRGTPRGAGRAGRETGGAPGGFAEKVRAARDAGALLVVIRRPAEDGESFDSILQTCREMMGCG